MKKITSIITGLLFTVIAMAQGQDTPRTSKTPYTGSYDKKYCALFQNGKMILTTGEKTITETITLTNGTKVTADCQLTKKDGTQTSLGNGECIDANGFIIVHDQLEKRK